MVVKLIAEIIAKISNAVLGAAFFAPVHRFSTIKTSKRNDAGPPTDDPGANDGGGGATSRRIRPSRTSRLYGRSMAGAY